MANPTKFLMREVATPSGDHLELEAAREDFAAFEEAYKRLTVVMGDPVLVKREPVGTGHLYYGDGEEPCHYCAQPVGKPHLDGCDHEVCPLCWEAGHDVQLGCGQHEVADHEVTLVGKFGGKRVRVVGLGFDEAGAQADAEAKWAERQRKVIRDYIKNATAKRDAAKRIGLDNIAAQWEANIATAEQRLAEAGEGTA